MTNTEALIILNKCRDMGFGRTTYTKEEYHTARDMAIKALQEQADRNEFYNWDAPIRHKADGDLISRQAVQNYIAHFLSLYLQDNVREAVEAIDEVIGDMPTVAIPPEHDGCKDCVYQDNPQDAMPCRECKHNYMDKWKARPNKVGHWEYNQYDSNPNIGNWHCSKCRNIVSDMPTCMGKPLYEFCPHCGSPMEIER